MKKLALAMTLIAASISTNLYAADEKRITETLTMNQGQNLEIDFPVGSIEIITVDGNELSIEIEIEGKDEGWFSKNRDVSNIELNKRVRDNRISLEIDEDNLNQEWVIKVPKSAAIDIEVGVGSIEIQKLENSVDADVGVGSIRIDTVLDDFKRIDLSTGVGDTSIKGFSGDLESSRNIVSSETSYSGNGEYSIEAEVGVGDIKVRK
ncbi:DUF4097 family beta strand repeat-containing protein [Pseudoalteromonas piratica]|uniref:Adhesin domain-containing protein n=1 Tax=Pseudoalteromonas piratica TaxID=1348114 RepID=A0A0A7EBL7_9GAMM|nr:hypothetical protein [Pseudoalteromonas piratica]AIY64015.1 hypothetical protein OM33_01740 [Pseudoalteromonas piratica]